LVMMVDDVMRGKGGGGVGGAAIACMVGDGTPPPMLAEDEVGSMMVE